MKVVKEVAVAGKTIEVILKMTSGNHSEGRAKKSKVTAEKIQKNNDRLAVIRLRRILNANFKKGDLHIVLTYSDAATIQQAKKDRDNFFRRLSRRMKKEGKELKYVAVTEYKHSRIHHHVVVNYNDLEAIQDIWGKGFVKSTSLDDSGNYGKLAEYLLKETQKSFREDDNPNKRRYSCSNNLIKPVVKRYAVQVSELFRDPEPIKGYYIPEEWNRTYEHPVTQLQHREYIMVALDEPRKYKVWPKGKEVSDKEYFRAEYQLKQLSIFEGGYNDQRRI